MYTILLFWYMSVLFMHIFAKSFGPPQSFSGFILSTTRKEVESFWNQQCLRFLWMVMQLCLCQVPSPSNVGFHKRICSSISSLVHQLLCMCQRTLSILSSLAFLVRPPNQKTKPSRSCVNGFKTNKFGVTEVKRFSIQSS